MGVGVETILHHAAQWVVHVKKYKKEELKFMQVCSSDRNSHFAWG